MVFKIGFLSSFFRVFHKTMKRLRNDYDKNQEVPENHQKTTKKPIFVKRVYKLDYRFMRPGWSWEAKMILVQLDFGLPGMIRMGKKMMPRDIRQVKGSVDQKS